MEIIKKDQENEFEQFVETHPNGSFMQSINWTKVKNNWGYEAIVSRNNNGEIIGAVLVLIRKMPLGKTFLYAPRGPVCDYNDYDTIKDLLGGVKIIAKKHNAYTFKMDPPVLEDSHDFSNKICELGFDFTPYMGDYTTMQTRINYMLNVEGQTIDEITSKINTKYRYKINLGKRKGLVCKTFDKTHIDDFYALMKITGIRDKFIVRPKEYFVKMLDAFDDDHCKLFLCYKDDIPLSRAIATQYAGKTCYVYGASSNEFRNYMPNYVMQWNMINWATENNCKWYDFQGIPYYNDPTNTLNGVYNFKKGFNGEVVKYEGEYDYIFSPLYNNLINFAERTLTTLKKMYRKYLIRK